MPVNKANEAMPIHAVVTLFMINSSLENSNFVEYIYDWRRKLPDAIIEVERLNKLPTMASILVLSALNCIPNAIEAPICQLLIGLSQIGIGDSDDVLIMELFYDMHLRAVEVHENLFVVHRNSSDIVEHLFDCHFIFLLNI
jgi:hypothetical protein